MAFSLSKNKNIKIECTDLVCGKSFPNTSTEFGDANQRRGMRRSRNEGANTWTIETSAPYDDGYLWRKYGTKNISSSNYPRSYFRCTYRDERNCTATKQVQQKDFTDPPVFLVTYSNSHSCNSTPCNSTPLPEAELPIRSGSSLRRPNLISFDFSEGPMHTNQHHSPLYSKPHENRLNSNQDVNFQFHDRTSHDFTLVRSQIVDSQERDAFYGGSLSDYSPLQGLDELDGFDDFVLTEYMNSSDMNSSG